MSIPISPKVSNASPASPLTEPWEPIYSKLTPDALISAFGWPSLTPMRAASRMAD